MLEFLLGCSGWSYSACFGHFYPQGLENSKWLRYYSTIIDYVEIDSLFYRVLIGLAEQNFESTEEKWVTCMGEDLLT
jgi:uncharacterized protein YecE (DUF72 family)